MENDYPGIPPAKNRANERPSLRSDLVWHPKQIRGPEVAPDLPDLPFLARSAEVLCYSFHRLEYWLSPSGVLREWVRLVAKVSLMLAIPALLLGSVITLILVEFESWSAALLVITVNLLKTAVCLVVLGGLISFALQIFRQRK